MMVLIVMIVTSVMSVVSLRILGYKLAVKFVFPIQFSGIISYRSQRSEQLLQWGSLRV